MNQQLSLFADPAVLHEQSQPQLEARHISDKVILFPGVSPADISAGGYKPNYRKGEPQTVYPIKSVDQLKDMATWIYQNKGKKYLLAFILGLNIGLRGKELMKLTMADLFNSDGSVKYIEDTGILTDRIVIRQSKTGKSRTVYLNTACVKALRWCFDTNASVCVNKEEYIFPSREGGHINRDTLYKVIKDAAIACGVVQNVGTHTMRKTWSWSVLEYTERVGLSHGDVTVLQRLLGHASPTTTLRYVGALAEEDKLIYHSVVLDIADHLIT